MALQLASSRFLGSLLLVLSLLGQCQGRERISLNKGWRFARFTTNPDNVVYDIRPDSLGSTGRVLKPWVLPTANEFITDPARQHQRPSDPPPSNISFVRETFDDSAWEIVNLPHDWAIKGPFYEGDDVPVTGGMGRLPVQGVGWYRQKLAVKPEDKDKSIYLEVDGAMSYPIVWLNGHLVGGWPYPYNSFYLDLTPYLRSGDDNQLAIRVDNPTDSSRWYPGGGIYRNVWLTKVEKVHVANYGTYIRSKDISAQAATVDLVVQVENSANAGQQVDVVTDVYELESETGQAGKKVAEFQRTTIKLLKGSKLSVNGSISIQNPRLWGPPPTQQPDQYVAVTRLYGVTNNSITDSYETRFGIRSVVYDPNKGLLVNEEHIRIQGVNLHHDLGSLGAAFNVRATERQLEILRDVGANAIRTSHNPPAPELLDLTDRMGFLVFDEQNDCWELQKNPSDFHLIFDDWHEPDLRAFIRRDRNHPSVYAWSFGNEVGEQSTGDAGAAIARMLRDIVSEEDPTRLSTASMNSAAPNSSFAQAMDIISLNYQGEGIRDGPAYSGLTDGSRKPPQYEAFHTSFPNKMIESSESAAAVSLRGTYLFPVTHDISAPVNDTSGGNSTTSEVSAYELYTADFGSSPDKVFGAQDQHAFVAGEFVWSGFDYLGEPTPYYSATTRSSYYGIIDLAGFWKDRAHLYQSRWRPEVRMAHILPHWNWPERVGLVTPVHVFSAAEEAELFLNNRTLGRRTKGEYEYRFRWDNVTYAPGELRVVTYKDGKEWASASRRTTGAAVGLRLSADRSAIEADGKDLSFVTLEVVDEEGYVVPVADNVVSFDVSELGELVATDNGDPRDLTSFGSSERKAFNGLALAVVRGRESVSGPITLSAHGDGLKGARIVVETYY